MAASKQVRVLTGTPGAFKQYKSNEDKDQWNGNKVYPWWVPGNWNFYTHGGYNQKMVGGHEYWICSNSSKENHEGIRFNHKDDIFNVNSKRKSSYSSSSSSSITYVNKGGYNFSFNNNVAKSADKNGFAYTVTTKDDDYIGGSPMPVVGVCFRWWAEGNGKYNLDIHPDAPVGNNDRSKNWTGEETVTKSVDIQINRMHLCYKEYDSGIIFSHPILPEGNNAGDIQFYNESKWSSNKNIKMYLNDSAAYNSEKALLVRAWHKEKLPENCVFIGFTVHFYMGKAANVNRVHSCHIGGMSPILESDLQVITSAGKNKDGGHQAVAWEPPIVSEQDLKERFDPKIQGKKLILIDDPGGNNNGTSGSYAPVGGNWKRSINVRDNSAVFKY